MDTEIQIEDEATLRNWEDEAEWSERQYVDYIDFIADCLREAA